MQNYQGLVVELFRLLFSVGGVIYLLYGFFVEFRAYRKGTFRPDVRYIVFGGISIGFGFLQWIIGFQLAVLGICFGLVATALSLQEGKHE